MIVANLSGTCLRAKSNALMLTEQTRPWNCLFVHLVFSPFGGTMWTTVEFATVLHFLENPNHMGKLQLTCTHSSGPVTRHAPSSCNLRLLQASCSSRAPFPDAIFRSCNVGFQVLQWGATEIACRMKSKSWRWMHSHPCMT